jgi:ApeA N-terminal domain 1
MVSAEQLHGHWWEPDRPDRRLPGTLDISDDGSMVLEVSGMMPGSEIVDFGAPLETVFGELRDGRAVTLADAIGGLPSGARGKLWSQVLPELALIGEEHVPNPTSAPSFAGVVAELDGLEALVDGIQLESSGNSFTGGLTFAAEPDVHFETMDGADLVIVRRNGAFLHQRADHFRSGCRYPRPARDARDLP